MSDEKHSPGPWKWDRDSSGYLIDANDIPVISGQEWEIPNDADARLIAAAPEMLALLREAGGWYCGEMNGVDTRKAIAALLDRIDGKTR